MTDTYLIIFKVAEHYQVIDIRAKSSEEAKEKCFIVYPEYRNRVLDSIKKV